MNRRQFLTGFSAAAAGPQILKSSNSQICPCTPMLAAAQSAGSSGWPAPRIKVTNMKAIGVSLTPDSDRPYVFVRIETDQGVVGWGEATLEGKAGAVLAAVGDFREFIVGQDPMKVEHHWQSMYVHTFYRAGPVIGSAISGIDQALWDIRGKVLGLPVYKLLGGPVNPKGVRGYYHARAGTKEEMARLRASAKQLGVTCFKSGIPGEYEWIETNRKIKRAVDSLYRLREGLGEDLDIAIDFHAKTSPSVATIICKEVEPLNLLFIEEPCPPENVKAMARISRRTTTPIATGERLIASFGCRELIEKSVVDILQPDINHVGGISALWKVGAMAEASGISMAPHACEGPIGGLATVHVDAAMPNFVVQEICSGVQPDTKEKIWEEWMGFPAMRMVDGYFPLPEEPGLGFELTEQALAKYPFGGTLPMARVFHADGSVAEW
ncbi:MAG: galactonate dehydratase [Acidobacteria bacterium]|nr:galactonate dehydratase [Acidobacteriota bacterium]